MFLLYLLTSLLGVVYTAGGQAPMGFLLLVSLCVFNTLTLTFIYRYLLKPLFHLINTKLGKPLKSKPKIWLVIPNTSHFMSQFVERVSQRGPIFL